MRSVVGSKVTPGSSFRTVIVTVPKVAGSLFNKSESRIDVVVPPSSVNGGKTSEMASIVPTFAVTELSSETMSLSGSGPNWPVTVAVLFT